MQAKNLILPLLGSVAFTAIANAYELPVPHTWAETYIANIPKQNLSEQEKNALLYIVEEEKLARDVYLTLSQRWNLPVFRNIARAEQHHMNMVRVLLQKYGLEDPTQWEDIGEFQNKKIQRLYNKLVKKGNHSLLDALRVGALIEETDIKDLEERLKETDNRDIQVVFKNLMKGSRNHLRAFIRLIYRFGGTYKSQILSQEQVQQILSTRIERGFYK